MRRTRTPPPAWWICALLACEFAIRHALIPGTPSHAPAQEAFFGFLIWLGTLIWNGLEAAGEITLTVLAWSVQQLWSFARGVWNTAIDLGSTVGAGFKDAWGFVEKLYDDILKPAWLKFWQLVDGVASALQKVFAPVIDFLQRVRGALLALYNNWIRPVLDTIDHVRSALRVLAALHLKFAQELDAQLARLESLIDAPFRYALGKINEVINLVNRVVDGNGLFQRLALIRSIQRDITYVDRVWHNMRANPFTDDELSNIADNNKPPTLDDAVAAFTAFTDSAGSEVSPEIGPARDAFSSWAENH